MYIIWTTATISTIQINTDTVPTNVLDAETHSIKSTTMRCILQAHPKHSTYTTHLNYIHYKR